jgi:hypothetical protein
MIQLYFTFLRVIFTEHDVRYTNNNDVILANGITIDGINIEKSKIIDKVANKQ